MRLLTEVEIEATAGGVMLDDGLTCREVSWAEYTLWTLGNALSHGGMLPL